MYAIKRLLIVFTVLASCSRAAPETEKTVLTVANRADAARRVYIAFGADSEVTASDWRFCHGKGRSCVFVLSAKASKVLPNPDGKYLNATLSFDAPVQCGMTKAEVNLNNPAWYDTVDISLVDGFSTGIQINADPTGGSRVQLGPVNNAHNNARLTGVYPYGCDVCVARKNPPCGIEKGTEGCKQGAQYDPRPPCQWHGFVKGGGDLTVTVVGLP